MNSASAVDELFQQWKAQGMTKEELITRTAEAELGWPYVWGAVGAPCSPEKRKYYANRSSCPEGESKLIISRCQALNGSGKSCGGCEFYPDNMRVLIDDCQGFVKQVLSRVGISLAGGGCTSMWNNNANWTQKGTKDHIPNQVCLAFCWSEANQNMSHVGIYIGNGNIIECSGTVRRNTLDRKIWTHYAVPKGLGGDTPMPTHTTLRRGDSGPEVVECQEDLIRLGYDLSPYGADGKFGKKTEAAVKQFQTNSGLKADGIVGPKTWEALDNAVTPGGSLYTVHIPHLTEYQADALIQRYAGSWKTPEGSD